MRAEEIIKRAQEQAERKAGVRMQARLPDAMWRRIQACAEATAMAAEEWVNLACRSWMEGKLQSVAIDEKELLATREESNVRWVRMPHDMDGRMLRVAILKALVWCEPKMKPATPQRGTERWREGKEYLLENSNAAKVKPWIRAKKL